MIRRHVAELRALLILSDALLAGAVLAFVSWLPVGDDSKSYWSGVIRPTELIPLVYAFGWVAALALSGRYRPRFRWTVAAEAADILKTTAWVALGTATFLFVVRPPDVSRLLFLLLFPSQAAATILSHTVVRLAFRRLQASEPNKRNVLIVGAGESGRAFAQRLEANPWLGLKVAGFLDVDDGLAATLPEGWAHLGGPDRLEFLLHELEIEDLAVCVPPWAWDDRIYALVHLAEDEGKIVHVPLGPTHRTFLRGHLEDIDGLPVYSTIAGPDRSIAMTAKRLIDVVVAGLGLLLLSPVLALVALAIIRSDGRPVLFVQERIGMHGRRFRMFKFRTMVRGAEAMLPDVLKLNRIVGPGFQLDDDPRVTRIGRILRRSSLDELPQLWNVLVGDMSIVGPRPAPITEVGAYEVWHRRRLSARPGITGLAQIEARNYTEFDQKANLDLQYIDRWSPWLDLRILIRTVRVLVRTGGR